MCNCSAIDEVRNDDGGHDDDDDGEMSVCNAVVSHGHGCTLHKGSCGKMNRGADSI